MKMGNTISAKEFKAKYIRANEGLFTTEHMMEQYGLYLTESKDQHIAELEKDVELGKSMYSGAIGVIAELREENKSLRSENASLRRALSECKAKARVGVNPDRT